MTEQEWLACHRSGANAGVPSWQGERTQVAVIRGCLLSPVRHLLVEDRGRRTVVSSFETLRGRDSIGHLEMRLRKWLANATGQNRDLPDLDRYILHVRLRVTMEVIRYILQLHSGFIDADRTFGMDATVERKKEPWRSQCRWKVTLVYDDGRRPGKAKLFRDIFGNPFRPVASFSTRMAHLERRHGSQDRAGNLRRARLRPPADSRRRAGGRRLRQRRHPASLPRTRRTRARLLGRRSALGQVVNGQERGCGGSAFVKGGSSIWQGSILARFALHQAPRSYSFASKHLGKRNYASRASRAGQPCQKQFGMARLDAAVRPAQLDARGVAVLRHPSSAVQPLRGKDDGRFLTVAALTTPYNSHPLRYSRRTYFSASGAFLTRILSASHSIFLPTR